MVRFKAVAPGRSRRIREITALTVREGGSTFLACFGNEHCFPLRKARSIMMNSSLILAGIPTLGMPEIIVILVIVLIIFGPKSLPSLGRALGNGLREFKSAASKFSDAINEEADRDSAQPPKPAPKLESDKKPTVSPAPKETVSQGTSTPNA